tara:strand:- start:92 stop:871 length:780 start_codon:yes stop_codon:yes gene_type:complete
MGNKRMGLGRLEALFEALKRDLNLGSGAKFNGISIDHEIPFELQGLAKPWTLNFGGDQVAGLATAPTTANILTEPIIALKCSRVLEHIANASDVPSSDVAVKVFGGTGVTGVDVAIGTTASPGVTPMVDQRISRLTGNVSGTVVMSIAADMAADDTETLILFTGNTFSSTGILKLTLHGDRELDAESSEVFVTAEGTDAMTRAGVPTDGDDEIVLTDTGDCTILAGSYLYFHSHHATDVTAVKGCIRTTGGTIAVTYTA